MAREGITDFFYRHEVRVNQDTDLEINIMGYTNEPERNGVESAGVSSSAKR